MPIYLQRYMQRKWGKPDKNGVIEHIMDYTPMDIYDTKPEDKIRCATLDAGWDADKRVAQQHLKVGEVYTVEYIEVHSWHTDVYLEEIPDVRFGSGFFENI